MGAAGSVEMDEEDPLIAGWLRRELEQQQELRSRTPSPPRPLPIAEDVARCPLPIVPSLSAAHFPLVSSSLGFSRADFRSLERRAQAQRWEMESGGRVISRLPAVGVEGADLEAHCRRIVASKRGAFYIGITEAPMVRWAGKAGHRREWDGMDVIAAFVSSAESGAMERVLISAFTGRDRSAAPLSDLLGPSPRRCQNIGRGGEHASVGSPHFVYVVWRFNTLLRRSR